MLNFRVLNVGAIVAPLLLLTNAWAHDATSKPETLDTLVTLVIRWMHILPAIISVGGSFFIFTVLMPAAKQILDDDTHKNLRATIMRRWKIIIHTCIALFLLSGFYNYLMITRHLHENNPQYHMLFGIKFLLALFVFFLAICLSSSKNWAATFRDNASFWMRILVFTSIIVVMLAGYMKVMTS